MNTQPPNIAPKDPAASGGNAAPVDADQQEGDGKLSTATTTSHKKRQARSTSTSSSRKKSAKHALPRRPLSAYNMYFRDQREVIKQQIASGQVPEDYQQDLQAALKRLQGSQKSAEFQAAAVTVAARWRVAPPAEKEYYERRAREEMEAYKKRKDEQARQQGSGTDQEDAKSEDTSTDDDTKKPSAASRISWGMQGLAAVSPQQDSLLPLMNRDDSARSFSSQATSSLPSLPSTSALPSFSNVSPFGPSSGVAVGGLAGRPNSRVTDSNIGELLRLSQLSHFQNAMFPTTAAGHGGGDTNTLSLPPLRSPLDSSSQMVDGNAFVPGHMPSVSAALLRQQQQHALGGLNLQDAASATTSQTAASAAARQARQIEQLLAVGAGDPLLAAMQRGAGAAASPISADLFPASLSNRNGSAALAYPGASMAHPAMHPSNPTHSGLATLLDRQQRHQQQQQQDAESWPPMTMRALLVEQERRQERQRIADYLERAELEYQQARERVRMQLDALQQPGWVPNDAVRRAPTDATSTATALARQDAMRRLASAQTMPNINRDSLLASLLDSEESQAANSGRPSDGRRRSE